MTSSLKGLVSRGATFIKTGSFHNNKNATGIFPAVDPEVDGPDCDKDCASCTVRYPSKFKIDEEDELYGHIKGWATQVLVATGKTDWVRDVEDEKGSVMEAFGKAAGPSNGRLMLSASNMHTPDEYHAAPEGRQPTTILLLPAFTVIEHVTPQDVPLVIQNYINPAPTTTTPLTAPITIPSPAPDSKLTSKPCPHKYLILLCSQKTRDARCGQSAPLLRKEFERHLRPLGLYRDLDDERPDGVGIYFISHVGGHKYSANVIIYRRADAETAGPSDFVAESNGNGAANGAAADGDTTNAKTAEAGAGQCIWLARVRPEDCEGIIKYTILQGKTVKPERQLRGGFDREKGLTSW
ncbi:hypothetical protein L228DRAFT_57036 [Xylona heveae TC161]|uniref:Sucrase/ferredoxin-like family protein n=1 Tax=Xylona heveae (strain CBS 132557 / TC161) TaxID=1328760 RepID=A0A161TFM0_XYLHT|nr:hypothetical protein L228DRAFT_57036 [Xylona heveae TC161]KZF24847.1 hypothetical protein L228DRAFT_57036 [Xylona heveae TC161]